MKLVFATNNRHKLDEVRAIVGDRVEVLSLNDIECHDEIPETADTLQGNALIKARYIYDKCREALRGEDFRNNAILAKFNIEYSAPVVSLLDDLSGFKDKNFAPSLRGDNLLSPTEETCRALEDVTGKKVCDTASYIAAIAVILDKLSKVGCSVADHALDTGFLESASNKKEKEILITVILAMILSTLFTLVPLLQQVSAGISIVICTVTAAAVCAVLFPIPDEKEAEA
jgi:hypothetical protein